MHDDTPHSESLTGIRSPWNHEARKVNSVIPTIARAGQEISTNDRRLP
ncbi:MAG: hypothetical protein OZSIB_0562 [Candidatus Ozemobacter sibiricus]|uniref:Uncharacterized protein n=1 Tax=Candidatus Ozemobacter sibiricus TaxID=2268124 RepID=A0A367ZNS8_9BACT|nr:MAG: hypothetical protein OZSIB_0562 [Candidatus Ozemobacter sibiricus]